MSNVCPGCGVPFTGEGYDPGCTYGCTLAGTCDHEYCTDACYYDARDRADEQRAEHFHGV